MMPPMNRAEAEKRELLVKEYVGRGYSANSIQRELQRQGLGMQRKVLLERVRHYRGSGAPKHPERNVPIRYRRRQLYSDHKSLAFYGTYRGESRRVSVVGSGRALYKVAPMIFRHPPRKKFLVISADELGEFPDYYLSGGYWDEKDVTS